MVSTSWLATSASAPLLAVMSYIHGCGMLGPCDMDFTWTTSPMAPSSISCLARRKPASKRRMKPICSFRPDARAASSMSVHSATFIAIGFSQNACRPAARASSTMPRWYLVGVTTTTACTAGSFSSSR